MVGLYILIKQASQTKTHGVPIQEESVLRKLVNPFDFSAGHIDPTRATDPGLIYDINPKDYKFCCSALVRFA